MERDRTELDNILINIVKETLHDTQNIHVGFEKYSEPNTEVVKEYLIQDLPIDVYITLTFDI